MKRILHELGLLVLGVGSGLILRLAMFLIPCLLALALYRELEFIFGPSGFLALIAVAAALVAMVYWPLLLLWLTKGDRS